MPNSRKRPAEDNEMMPPPAKVDPARKNFIAPETLDAIALELLKQHYEVRKYPKMLHNDCFAVCCVGENLWIASNKITIDIDIVIKLLSKNKIKCGVLIVKNQWKHSTSLTEKRHAEMQLLNQLIEQKCWHVPYYMGVSKKCCSHCAKCLNKHGIKYNGVHDNVDLEMWDPVDMCSQNCPEKECLLIIRGSKRLVQPVDKNGTPIRK